MLTGRHGDRLPQDCSGVEQSERSGYQNELGCVVGLLGTRFCHPPPTKFLPVTPLRHHRFSSSTSTVWPSSSHRRRARRARSILRSSRIRPSGTPSSNQRVILMSIVIMGDDLAAEWDVEVDQSQWWLERVGTTSDAHAHSAPRSPGRPRGQI
jgi:hypothetical protein